MGSVILGFHPLHPDTAIPKFATRGSACFDLACSLFDKKTVKGFDHFNRPFFEVVKKSDSGDGFFYVPQWSRMMVPTNLILDIPTGYSVRVHSRSGVAYKQGLVLANQEGVIDSDYVEELFLLMHNTSDKLLQIGEGDRIAQGELVQSLDVVMALRTARPEQKTDRVGGIGSTGVGSEAVKEFVDGYDK